MEGLVVECEEQSGEIWTTLLRPCANAARDAVVKETAFSEAVGLGWRYGLTRAANRGNHTPCCCSYDAKGWNIVVDLIDTLSRNLNIEIEFSCCLVKLDATTLRGKKSTKKSRKRAEVMSLSRLQSNCHQISSGKRGQFGFCHEIGSFCSLKEDDCILVKACISVDLTSAQKFSSSPIDTAAAVPANPAMPPVKLELANALERSLSSGTFIDIRFNVFSCRRKVGGGRRLCRPLPLYAASVALNRLEFKPGDSGDASNIRRMTLCGILSDIDCERSFLDVGDEYEEDSDFDSDEASVIEEAPEQFSSASEAGGSETAFTGSPKSSRNTYDDITACIPPVSSTFVATSGAYKTWKAFLFYAYTGLVEFSPLTSNPRKDEGKTQLDPPPNDTRMRYPPCSPKSMYRLAHKLQLESLKQLAFEEIRRNLSKDNILHEVLSKFTAEHAEIREMETAFLMGLRKDSEVMDSLRGKMPQIVRGEMPHCEEVLTTIMMDLWKTS